MSYPIVPHPRVINTTPIGGRVTYANTGASAYARLSSGVKTFITRTIPAFAKRIAAGIYQVARFLYNVAKRVVGNTTKFVWTLAQRSAALAKRGATATASGAKKAAKYVSKTAPKAVKGGAKIVGKAVGGSLRRVADFNEGVAQGVAGDRENYIPRKYREDPKKFEGLNPAKQAKISKRADNRRAAVAGFTKRALLASEISGGLKLVTRSIENFDPLSNLDLHGIRLSKQGSGKKTSRNSGGR